MTYYKVVCEREDGKLTSVIPFPGNTFCLQYKPGIWRRLPKELRKLFQPMFVFTSLKAARHMVDSLPQVSLQIWECEIKRNKSNRRLINNVTDLRLVLEGKMPRARALTRSRRLFGADVEYANSVRLKRCRLKRESQR